MVDDASTAANIAKPGSFIKRRDADRAVALYQRKQLELAAKTEVFKALDYIEKSNIPRDDHCLENWLNINNSRSLTEGNGARVDFHAPLIFDMIFIQDDLLKRAEEVEIPFWKDGTTYKMTVSTLAPVMESHQFRFDVDPNLVQKFIQDLLELEVGGVRARASYQIKWGSSSSAAENYLWTILSYKVNYEFNIDC